MEHHILSTYHCALYLATQFTSLAVHNLHWEAGSSPARTLSWLGLWVFGKLMLSIICLTDWSPTECISRRVRYALKPLDSHVANHLDFAILYFNRWAKCVVPYVFLKTFGSRSMCFRLITWFAFKTCLFQKATNRFVRSRVIDCHDVRCTQFHSPRLMEFGSFRFRCKVYSRHFNHCIWE